MLNPDQYTVLKHLERFAQNCIWCKLCDIQGTSTNSSTQFLLNEDNADVLKATLCTPTQFLALDNTDQIKSIKLCMQVNGAITQTSF